MSSNGHNRPPNDPKVVGEIVNKLKKQGLFDKFRRDCLSDVDTKPAYLNLSRRVDTLCSNFLSNITWAPDLNKNKLRESLRNEVTQGKMLSNGVGLIVSQVVNPKIKTFKPEIDAVVCEFFGIDPAEWAEKLRSREQQRSDRFKQLAHDETPNNPQMGNTAHMAGSNQQVFSGGSNFGVQGMAGVGYMMNQMQQTPNIPGMAGLSSSMAQSIQNTLGAQMPATMFPNMPPTIPNFSLPPPGYNPQLPYDPSVPPPNIGQTTGAQNFSGLQQQNFAQIPGMANMTYQNQVMMQSMSGADMAAYAAQQAALATSMTPTTMTPLDSANNVSTDLKDSKNLEKKEKEKKKELASLTVEDLLNVAIPNKPSQDKRRDSKKMDSYGKDRDRDRRREGAGSPIISHGRRELSSKPERKDSDRRSDRMDERRLDRSDDKLGRHGDEKRGERLEDRRSEHSDFSERSHVSDSMPRLDRDRERDKMRGRDRDGDRGYLSSREGGRPSPGRSGGSLRHSEPMIKPPSPPPEPPPKPEGKVYHFAWDDIDSELSDSDMALSSVHTSDLSSFDDGLSDASGLEDISSDDLRVEDEGITKPPEPPEPPTEEPVDMPDVKQKPRKLIALQYNYSDSEEEETREERKERIATEKEERYLKRQLRRAELEARKEEKLVSARKKAAEKEKAESQGIVQPPEPEPEPERKQRRVRANRTKEALKDKLRAEKREQKVQQMAINRRMAVRRQRKRNSKYMSDDFTSIFTDKRKILSNEGYGESGQKSDVDYSPGRPVSPSTPTQDEMDYSTSDADVIITSQEVVKPVYDGPAALGVRSRRIDDHHPGGRPTTPFSDMSDKAESDMGRGRRRRRTLSGRHSPDLEEKKPVRQQEAERAHSQRYDDSDLYKPHTSYRTRRRGTSPVDKDVPARSTGPAGSPPRGGFVGRRPGVWTPNTPPVATRGVRPPSPPSEDEHRPPGWQRHGSQEGFKRGRPQHFPGSPERPAKVPISPEGRPPALYQPRPSPVTKPATDPGSAGEEGAEKRVRLPLSMISFGEAAKQSRQPPKPAIPIHSVSSTPIATRDKRAPPPPRDMRERELFAEFGEAARRTEAARRMGDLSLTTTTLRERMSLNANAIAPVAAIKQRTNRREGITPHVETSRGGFQRKGGFQPGTPKAAMGGPPRPIQPHIPDGEMHAPEWDREAPRLDREHRPAHEYKKRRSRQSSQDDDDWPSIPKPKSLEQEREEWEPISDDEDLGDNYMETQGEGRLDKRDPNRRKRQRSQEESPDRQWDSQSQDSIHDVSGEILRDMYDSPDETSQDGHQSDNRYQESSRQEPRDRLTDRTQDKDNHPSAENTVRRIRDTELEEGEEEDSSDYERRDSYIKPPEPPEEEQPPTRKPQRSASVSSGELKDDEEDLHRELPKAGMSPTANAKYMKMTEMPRPGLSPSCSPSRSLPRSPSRSIPRSPSRSIPRSPTRSMPRSPSRSVPRSPTRSIPRSVPRSPTRSMTRSPTRSIPRSVPRSPTRSPTRSVPRSPTRSLSRSPTRSIPRSPARSIHRSPTRSRSPLRSIPLSPSRPIPFGGPSTPPDQSEGRPHTPMEEPVSSPESGEVGDDDYSSEKDGPLQSDADCPPSPPLRHGMRDMDRPPSPPSPSEYRGPPSPDHNSGRGHRSGAVGGLSMQYTDHDTGMPSGRSPPIPNTRATRRRTEEEALPIAKRLRR